MQPHSCNIHSQTDSVIAAIGQRHLPFHLLASRATTSHIRTELQLSSKTVLLPNLFSWRCSDAFPLIFLYFCTVLHQCELTQCGTNQRSHWRKALFNFLFLCSFSSSPSASTTVLFKFEWEIHLSVHHLLGYSTPVRNIQDVQGPQNRKRDFPVPRPLGPDRPDLKRTSTSGRARIDHFTPDCQRLCPSAGTVMGQMAMHPTPVTCQRIKTGTDPPLNPILPTCSTTHVHPNSPYSFHHLALVPRPCSTTPGILCPYLM